MSTIIAAIAGLAAGYVLRSWMLAKSTGAPLAEVLRGKPGEERKQAQRGKPGEE
jgi:hypothetical protein